MALSIMQKANIDAVKPDVHGLISKQSVMLDTVSVTKVTFHPGSKWSQDLKAYAGTDSCLLPHVAYILQGAIEGSCSKSVVFWYDCLARQQHKEAADGLCPSAVSPLP